MKDSAFHCIIKLIYSYCLKSEALEGRFEHLMHMLFMYTDAS